MLFYNKLQNLLYSDGTTCMTTVDLWMNDEKKKKTPWARPFLQMLSCEVAHFFRYQLCFLVTHILELKLLTFSCYRGFCYSGGCLTGRHPNIEECNYFISQNNQNIWNRRHGPMTRALAHRARH